MIDLDDYEHMRAAKLNLDGTLVHTQTTLHRRWRLGPSFPGRRGSGHYTGRSEITYAQRAKLLTDRVGSTTKFSHPFLQFPSVNVGLTELLLSFIKLLFGNIKVSLHRLFFSFQKGYLNGHSVKSNSHKGKDTCLLTGGDELIMIVV